MGTTEKQAAGIRRKSGDNDDISGGWLAKSQNAKSHLRYL
jgi:hypothetical protein